jgi:penicillin-binding protein 1B
MKRLRRIQAFVLLGIAVLGAIVFYVADLDRTVRREFEGRHWDLPAKVYAAPTELYAGAPLVADDLERELKLLHYRAAADPDRPGTYRRHGESIELNARRTRFADELREPIRLNIATAPSGVVRMTAAGGAEVPVFRLDPPLIGSIFPIHGEDRVVLAPGEIPPLLIAALKAVEDRRFDVHHGVDPRGILRALWVDVRAGRIEQGGSTLTQQLVKSYFLDERQTFSRKLTEAIMAWRLEAHFTKTDILTAYINEIYLGQDGERAIHGFGLASEFYFALPIDELNLQQLATLVGLVRGPSYYDPRHHPERARARRDLVLKVMADAGAISQADADAAAKKALGVLPTASGAYYPAYLDFVRRTLKRDYREADLAAAGLAIFTSLEPRAQAAAERSLTHELVRLDARTHRKDAQLQGAVVIARPDSGEVVAIVGGRQVGFDGFDRALDARRQIGSLIKPAVYLAALESGKYNAATLVDDVPIEVKFRNGDTWRPDNYSHQSFGPVPVVHALAESLNLATVHVGLDVGVAKVAQVLPRLGLDRTPPLHPALLLGSADLTPLEVAQFYQVLANGGFLSRLRAVRAVLDAQGRAVRTFPMEVTPVADASIVYQLDSMLKLVVARGTARAAEARFQPVVLAGKTGTSSDLRDSWFAGFSGSHLAVVWVGYDDSHPTGLSGATGALPVWIDVMAALKPSSFDPPMPDGTEMRTIDFWTGQESSPACATDVVSVALPRGTVLPGRPGCGPESSAGLLDRAKSWFDRLTH